MKILFTKIELDVYYLTGRNTWFYKELKN